MDNHMILDSIRIVKKQQLYYSLNQNNRIRTFQPWLGSSFAFAYNFVMKNSVFPGKFNASIEKHFYILKKELGEVSSKKVLEFATGNGNLSEILPCNNKYCGVDISPALMQKARKRFLYHGFREPEFYVADALETPFKNEYFDLAICNLSLNFFTDLDKFISETARILKPGHYLFCSVPLPENKLERTKIRGLLYTQEKLRESFQKNQFDFSPLPYKNGAIFYFKAKSKL